MTSLRNGRRRARTTSLRTEKLENKELLASDFTLQVLHTSDLEGGVEAIDDAGNFAAVVEALESDAEANGVPSILLSAGDNYLPGPFFGAAGDRSLRDVFRAELDNPAAREGVGRIDISIMNTLGFDASAVGNHEFDAGASTFSDIIGTDIRNGDEPRWLGAQFPFLSSNLDFSGEGALAGLVAYADGGILPSTAFQSTVDDLASAAAAPKLAPATIVETGGELIGVVGATTQVLASITSPGGVEVIGPEANDMAALAGIVQPIVDQLKEGGINKIILVSHLQQISLETELIGLLSGVDVVVAGGSDTLLADADDRLRVGDVAAAEYPQVLQNADGEPALLVSSDGQYKYVGRLQVGFDADGVVVVEDLDAAVNGPLATDEDGVTALWGEADPFAEGTKGTAVRALTSAVAAIVQDRDGETFGSTDVYLEGRRSKVRTEETNLGNLTADANLAAAKAVDPTVVVSIKNGGGIRAEIGAIDGFTGELLAPTGNPQAGKEPGEISQLDLEGSLRFNNRLTLLTVSAHELHELMEHSVAASDPGATPGRFPQIGGMAFSFDPARPAGDRVRSLAVLGEDGTPNDIIVKDGAVVGDSGRPIRLVTLNFLAGGGDGYAFDLFGEDLVNVTNAAGEDMGEQEAMALYLAANFAETPYARSETPITQDTRIQNLTARPDTVLSPLPIELNVLGGFSTGIFDEGAAEIVAHDPASQRLFFTNANSNELGILDMSDPANLSMVSSVDLSLFGADPTAFLPPTARSRLPWRPKTMSTMVLLCCLT